MRTIRFGEREKLKKATHKCVLNDEGRNSSKPSYEQGLLLVRLSTIYC